MGRGRCGVSGFKMVKEFDRETGGVQVGRFGVGGRCGDNLGRGERSGTKDNNATEDSNL